MTTSPGSEPSVLILTGDCLQTLRGVADSSVDSVVTDPPYGLSFMGKSWDNYGTPLGFQEWCTLWAGECLRVLKPGGHVLAFGGTRLAHRLTSGIEDAGFEIRDVITWHYASGFPKSLDVSKAIDKAAGAEREVIDSYARKGRSGGILGIETDIVRDLTAPATADAARWEGWGTALKPASEPIVVARKPLSGTVAATVLAHGTGALNIDGCRVGSEEITATRTSYGYQRDGSRWDKREPETVTTSGRWPSNVVFSHAEDCEEVGTRTIRGPKPNPEVPYGDTRQNAQGNQVYGKGLANAVPAVAPRGDETVPAWDCAPGCPVAELDRQSGVSKSVASGKPRGTRPGGFGDVGAEKVSSTPNGTQHNDTGCASRFYMVAKPSKRERVGCFICTFCEMPQAGFSHPQPPAPACVTCGCATRVEMHATVKPLQLMRYLVRLVTPPGGTVLEPFAGSGTTVEAALLEGFSVIACEKTGEYLPLIRERIRRVAAQESPGQPKPKAVRTPRPVVVDDLLPF